MGAVWDDIPTGGPNGRDERKRPKSRSPGPGERLTLMLCEDSVGWYLTHFMNRRTKPCLGARCKCQAATPPLAKRWQGYILGMEMPRRLIVLAMLTRNVWDTCTELRDSKTSLKGAQLVLTRKGGAQGIVEAQLAPGWYPLAQVPLLPYTHKDQLLRVWFGGMDDYVDLNQFFQIEGLREPVNQEDKTEENPPESDGGE